MAKYETAALQDPQELAAFIDFIREQKVSSYLEIGAKHGGSLWHIGRQLPKGSRIVAVDLPHGDASFKESQPHLEACVEALCNMRYDAHLIIGDSTDPAVVKSVLNFAPFDLCFIDANHTTKYVWADWINYGPMARLVAFHDIGWKEENRPGKKPIEVPRIWNEIKRDYRHKEINLCKRDNGIGILWRTP
jgi:cephalosporin hydroxylase